MPDHRFMQRHDNPCKVVEIAGKPVSLTIYVHLRERTGADTKCDQCHCLICSGDTYWSLDPNSSDSAVVDSQWCAGCLTVS